MKKIGRSDIIGQRGMAHIESVVLSMGYMFYATGGVEAGIDGFIELRDVETGEVGNLLLQLQGKATEKERLAGETETSFEFPVSDADIGYWTQGTAPVLFVVVHLKSGKAYWKSVKDWFSDPDRLSARKIVFDKAEDEFALGAKPAVTSIALSARPGAASPGVRIQEELLINLVEVSFSSSLYWAPTDFATDRESARLCAPGTVVPPRNGSSAVRRCSRSMTWTRNHGTGSATQVRWRCSTSRNGRRARTRIASGTSWPSSIGPSTNS
jgi:Domain of unknown function (DUF4365)